MKNAPEVGAGDMEGNSSKRKASELEPGTLPDRRGEKRVKLESDFKAEAAESLQRLTSLRYDMMSLLAMLQAEGETRTEHSLAIYEQRNASPRTTKQSKANKKAPKGNEVAFNTSPQALSDNSNEHVAQAYQDFRKSGPTAGAGVRKMSTDEQVALDEQNSIPVADFLSQVSVVNEVRDGLYAKSSRKEFKKTLAELKNSGGGYPRYLMAPMYVKMDDDSGGVLSRVVLGPGTGQYLQARGGSDSSSVNPVMLERLKGYFPRRFVSGHLLNAEFGGTPEHQNVAIFTTGTNMTHKNFDNRVKEAAKVVTTIYEQLEAIGVDISEVCLGIFVEVSVMWESPTVLTSEGAETLASNDLKIGLLKYVPTMISNLCQMVGLEDVESAVAKCGGSDKDLAPVRVSLASVDKLCARANETRFMRQNLDELIAEMLAWKSAEKKRWNACEFVDKDAEDEKVERPVSELADDVVAMDWYEDQGIKDAADDKMRED